MPVIFPLQSQNWLWKKTKKHFFEREPSESILCHKETSGMALECAGYFLPTTATATQLGRGGFSLHICQQPMIRKRRSHCTWCKHFYRKHTYTYPLWTCLQCRSKDTCTELVSQPSHYCFHHAFSVARQAKADKNWYSATSGGPQVIPPLVKLLSSENMNTRIPWIPCTVPTHALPTIPG